MNSSYLPIALVVAVVAIAYSISKDNTETSSSNTPQVSAQAAQERGAGAGGATSEEGKRAAQASTQKEGSDEGPIDQAWNTVKEELKEGREDLVDAFTDKEKSQAASGQQSQDKASTHGQASSTSKGAKVYDKNGKELGEVAVILSDRQGGHTQVVIATGDFSAFEEKGSISADQLDASVREAICQGAAVR